TPHGTTVTTTVVGYGVTRPAVSFASHRVGTRTVSRSRPGHRQLSVSPRLLAAGCAVMLVASGPTLLAVPLTTELHGRAWVAGTAVAFSLGCLLSTVAVEFIGRMNLPSVLRWSLWGLGMLIGWIFAPAHAVAVLFAQFFAGMAQTAFEGDMDARVATKAASPRGVTAGLATAAALRAFGSAAAVAMAPPAIAQAGIGWLGGALAAALAALAVLRLVRRWSRSAADRVVGVAPARDH
ncbi:MAG TPA: hypothetical protein VH016_03250, partial [Actinomycetota bacterium]|nr:hypothetical protein [Actinomycetota bacterium]